MQSPKPSIKSFTIYTKFWETSYVSEPKLYNGEKFCLWGFYGGAIGLKREEMYNKGFLADCFDYTNRDLDFLFEEVWWGKQRFSFQTLGFYLNDKEEKLDKRVSNLRSIFKKVGIEVKLL